MARYTYASFAQCSKFLCMWAVHTVHMRRCGHLQLYRATVYCDGIQMKAPFQFRLIGRRIVVHDVLCVCVFGRMCEPEHVYVCLPHTHTRISGFSISKTKMKICVFVRPVNMYRIGVIRCVPFIINRSRVT